jgi:hypothetical protein
MKRLALAVLALCGSAHAQSGVQNYERDYTGVWAINGNCDSTTFIFSNTWIERAGEDYCPIQSIDNRSGDVVVTAKCWHGSFDLGKTTYTLSLSPEGGLKIAGLRGPAVKKCGPVPQKLIDDYAKRAAIAAAAKQ